MSIVYRYLNFGLIVWLFLKFVSNAIAETPKEPVQASTDQVIKVLQTIRSPQEINKNRNALRRILLIRFDFAAMAQPLLGNRRS